MQWDLTTETQRSPRKDADNNCGSKHEATVAPYPRSRSLFLRGLCAFVVKLFLAAREPFFRNPFKPADS
jgi:hypothetical protein